VRTRVVCPAAMVASEQARHLAEAKLRCTSDALRSAQELAHTRERHDGELGARVARALRQQRDQAVQTAHRLRLRLAATQVAATQHARLAAQHAVRAEVRWSCLLLVCLGVDVRT
jgi:hypothetical protein